MAVDLNPYIIASAVDTDHVSVNATGSGQDLLHLAGCVLYSVMRQIMMEFPKDDSLPEMCAEVLTQAGKIVDYRMEKSLIDVGLTSEQVAQCVARMQEIDEEYGESEDDE